MHDRVVAFKLYPGSDCRSSPFLCTSDIQGLSELPGLCALFQTRSMSSSTSSKGLRQRSGATRPAIASNDSGRRASQDGTRVDVKGKGRASTLPDVREHRRESTSGSDDLDEEEDYLQSSGYGRERDSYGKYANGADDHDTHEAEHSFAGPAHYVSQTSGRRADVKLTC